MGILRDCSIRPLQTLNSILLLVLAGTEMKEKSIFVTGFQPPDS
jgi:hypothetical protein